MTVQFGREICGEFEIANRREWLVTNGIGGFASGTVAGSLTRRYHGYLVAALAPPLSRTLLLAKLDETINYDNRQYPLFTNQWAEGDIDPHGYRQIEGFNLEGTVPVWRYACGDARIEKRVWMSQGENTTYIEYRLLRASAPLKISIKALANFRDFHSLNKNRQWGMSIEPLPQGLRITAPEAEHPWYLLCARAEASPAHEWYSGFYLPVEAYRGLDDHDDLLLVGRFLANLNPGDSLTVVASTRENPDLYGSRALERRHNYESTLLAQADKEPASAPPWIRQLVLAADQFIVDRPLPDEPTGKSIIAGYPWFGDWGRDTMISLPGLTVATGRFEAARAILRTFARYVDKGMLPNRFPDNGGSPEYNTVDATLWYFEALRAYHTAAGDDELIEELFPILKDIIAWHQRGTRYSIQMDPADGLLYAGVPGVQLTWMDAKVGDWVVTPRIGKPVEVNALWYNSLKILMRFAGLLGEPAGEFEEAAALTREGFYRFWIENLGYCFDVLDGPEGDDPSLRPNQILAVSLPESPLTPDRQQGVVEACGRQLLVSFGLRSLTPGDPQYQGHYGGDQRQRDSAYHRGTAWGWLLGPFALAYARVFDDPAGGLAFLEPMQHHLSSAGLGSLSEIFDGDPPMAPRGCIAQAWTVAEVLRVWFTLQNMA